MFEPGEWAMLGGSALALLLAVVVAAVWAVRQLPRVEPVRGERARRGG